MLVENQDGVEVHYHADFFDVVTTTMCGNVDFTTFCSGSGVSSEVKIQFSEDLDVSKKDEMFPLGSRLVVMCDRGDIVSDLPSGFSDDQVGGYRFLAFKEVTIAGNQVSRVKLHRAVARGGVSFRNASSEFLNRPLPLHPCTHRPH